MLDPTALHSPRIQHAVAPGNAAPSCCGCSLKTKKAIAVALPILLAIILGTATVGMALAGIPIVVVACIGVATLVVLVATTILAKRKIKQFNTPIIPIQLQNAPVNPSPDPSPSPDPNQQINPISKPETIIEPLIQPPPKTATEQNKQAASPKKQPTQVEETQVEKTQVEETQVEEITHQQPISAPQPSVNATSNSFEEIDGKEELTELKEALKKNGCTRRQIDPKIINETDTTLNPHLKLNEGVVHLRRMRYHSGDILLTYSIFVNNLDNASIQVGVFNILIKQYKTKNESLHLLHQHPLNEQTFPLNLPGFYEKAVNNFYSAFRNANKNINSNMLRLVHRQINAPLWRVTYDPSSPFPPRKTNLGQPIPDQLKKTLKLIQFWQLYKTPFNGSSSDCNIELDDYYYKDNQCTLIWKLTGRASTDLPTDSSYTSFLRVGITDKVIAYAFEPYPEYVREFKSIQASMHVVTNALCREFPKHEKWDSLSYRSPTEFGKAKGPMWEVFDSSGRVLPEKIRTKNY